MFAKIWAIQTISAESTGNAMCIRTIPAPTLEVFNLFFSRKFFIGFSGVIFRFAPI
jgi:hypothetical protein